VTDHPPGTGRVLPAGDRALLVECADAATALGLWRRLRAAPPPGVVEPVVAARTVLVRVGEGAVDRVRAALEGWVTGPADRDAAGGAGEPDGGAGEVVLETVYDGADLLSLAAVLGTSVEAVVARHQGTAWVCAFLGFAPGFAYLRAVGDWPEVARHASPRTRVPAGSVAVAGPWSAVYPTASPGGWQLLGRTDAAVWDLERAEPALLPPGTTVRFRPVRARALVGPAGAAPQEDPQEDPRGDQRGDQPGDQRGDQRGDPRTARPPRDVAATPRTQDQLGRPVLEVLEPGPLCLVQDLGRRGHLSLGVPTSGALDRRAMVRANHLVGNDRDRAVLEVMLGGLVLRALDDVVVAVTGAPVPVRVDVDGRRRRPPSGRPFLVPGGAELALGSPAQGLRTYVAVRGGLGGPTVLGSRASDVLSGLGPPPVRAGDLLRVLPAPGTAVAGAPDDAAHAVPAGSEHTVRVLPGPRADWLTPSGLTLLATQRWEVTPRSNRVGLRLDGPELERAVTRELPSEGTVPGAVQVPPDGRPVIFLADHPVTGGYPVVAVVRDADLDRLGQLRPGDRLRLTPPAAGLRARP
jgi:biotin-dependent carboxylase-like uncharacterized protein